MLKSNHPAVFPLEAKVIFVWLGVLLTIGIVLSVVVSMLNSPVVALMAGICLMLVVWPFIKSLSSPGGSDGV